MTEARGTLYRRAKDAALSLADAVLDDRIYGAQAPAETPSDTGKIPDAPATPWAHIRQTEVGEVAVPRQFGVSPAATGPNPYETSFCDEHIKNSAKADGFLKLRGSSIERLRVPIVTPSPSGERRGHRERSVGADYGRGW
jgi:hypothetical protein